LTRKYFQKRTTASQEKERTIKPEGGTGMADELTGDREAITGKTISAKAKKVLDESIDNSVVLVTIIDYVYYAEPNLERRLS